MRKLIFRAEMLFSAMPKDQSPSEISVNIEKAILERFNYNIPVMIRTVSGIERYYFPTILSLRKEILILQRWLLSFFMKRPSEAQIQKVEDIDYPPDKFKIIGREIYHLLSEWFWQDQSFIQISSKTKWGYRHCKKLEDNNYNIEYS